MSTAAFYAAVRPLFGGTLSQSQVDGLNIILDATKGLPVSHRAYLLATTQHETAHTMRPVRETVARTDDEAIARLERAWAKGQMRWVSAPYWRKDAEGKSWLGRGYVQLTHKTNYERASKITGVDLVANPNAAMRPDVAAKILVTGCSAGIFTGKRLSDYLPGDYVNARRVVNGTDRAADIAKLAVGYEAALLKVPVPVPVIDAEPVDARPQPEPAAPASYGPFAIIIAAIVAVAAYFGVNK